MVVNQIGYHFPMEPITSLCLVNEASLSTLEMLTLKLALADYLLTVCPPWSKPVPTIVSSTSPVAGSNSMFITTRNRKGNAGGFHAVENGSAVAYCLPSTVSNRFGTYRPARWSKAFPNKPSTLTTPEYFLGGLLAVLCHEALELIADSDTKTVAPHPDSLGHHYLLEPADPVMGSLYMKKINGVNCVFPDAVYPSWYDLNGKSPYSISGKFKPFEKTAQGYAYWINEHGVLVKV